MNDGLVKSPSTDRGVCLCAAYT